MKEYEYIMEALEGYLCDELTCIICSENYRNRSYEQGYRDLYFKYRNLHKDFENNRTNFMDPSREKSIKEAFYHQCQEERESVRNRFQKDMQVCVDFDIDVYAKQYLNQLEEEEKRTTAKRICLYPYLVSVMREKGRVEK